MLVFLSSKALTTEQAELEVLKVVTPKEPTKKDIECNASCKTQNVKHNVTFYIIGRNVSQKKTITKIRIFTIAKKTSKMMMATNEIAEIMINTTKMTKQDGRMHLEADVIYVKEQL